jgi:hypothetical protein
MRLILKKEKKRPKAPKTATMATLERYNQKLKEIEKYNSEVRAYNRSLCAKAEYTQRAVAGFGKKGKK